jgi:hypothetical protein
MPAVFALDEIILKICALLNIGNLYQWSLTSKRIRSAVLNYFYGFQGMRQRVWDSIESITSKKYADCIKEFQNQTNAVITGSFVLKVFTGDDWKARDLDVFVALNRGNIEIFKQFIAVLSSFGEKVSITAHDSLTVLSFQTADRPARNCTKKEGLRKRSEQPQLMVLRDLLKSIKTTQPINHLAEPSYLKHVTDSTLA